jgi:hypothetical protein
MNDPGKELLHVFLLPVLAFGLIVLPVSSARLVQGTPKNQLQRKPPP